MMKRVGKRWIKELNRQAGAALEATDEKFTNRRLIVVDKCEAVKADNTVGIYTKTGREPTYASAASLFVSDMSSLIRNAGK